MTKETLGYVRLEWTCPACGSRNPGPKKTCGSCGAAQPEDVQFEQPAQEDLIVAEDEVARAKAGPDVHCAFCGARNPADAESCTQCGADLSEGVARDSGKVLGAHRAEATEQEVPCPSCGALNPSTVLECTQCGASMTRPRPEPRRAARRAAAPQRSSCGLVAGILIGGAVLLLILFIFLSGRTEEAVGRVASVSWTRSIAIQALEPVTHEAWRDDLPTDSVLRVCSPRVHHTQDSPAHNSKKVCGTPYTVDTGSGYGEVVQDCRYDVYRDWCEYTVEEWKRMDVVLLEGQDIYPRWPITELRSGQREGEREETYKCIFDVDGKRLTYTTRDTEQFGRCQIGSRWNLKLNTFNAIVAIEPAE